MLYMCQLLPLYWRKLDSDVAFIEYNNHVLPIVLSFSVCLSVESDSGSESSMHVSIFIKPFPLTTIPLRKASCYSDWIAVLACM